MQHHIYPDNHTSCPTLEHVNDEYPTPEGKIYLAIESAKVAKRITVAEDGIGEDLTFNLLAWRRGSLSAICQLDGALMVEPPESRLGRTVEAALLCRTGYGATAFTFVAEGYCADDPTQIDSSIPLNQQFLTNQHIRECLTITHLEAGETTMIALPYSYGVPRRVEFGTPMRYPKRRTQNRFLLSLHDILGSSVPLPPLDDETWRDITAEEIASMGFHINHSMDFPD